MNSEVACTITSATDQDHRYAPGENPQHTYPYDTLTYTWSATAGSWKNGVNTGQSVTWVAPSSPSSGVTITCTISDAAVIPPGETGNRNDTNVQRSVTVKVYDMDITHCPTYFVPGHENIIRYQIYPDAYSASWGKLEIFERDENGDPIGFAIYTSTNLNLSGGAERSFTYTGTEISYIPGKYIVKISVGESAQNCVSDQAPFDVKAWDLLALFWDDLTDSEKAAIIAADGETIPDYVANWDPDYPEYGETRPEYCAGINSATVASSYVTVTVWYWDETENGADLLYIDNGTPTEDISDSDWENVWGQDLQDKPWYDERGSSITNLNGTFYSMSEAEQYFYLKIVVALDGVLDNVGNEFDAEPDTSQRESTIRYKLKIDGEGNMTILEEVIQ